MDWSYSTPVLGTCVVLFLQYCPMILVKRTKAGLFLVISQMTMVEIGKWCHVSKQP